MVYNMAVWPEGAARLRRARNLLGYCLGWPLHLFLGLGLGAIGLVLLGAGAGAGAQQCVCRGLGWSVDRPQVDAETPQAGRHFLLVPGNGGHSEGHLLRRKSQVIVRTVFSCHQRGK